MRPTILAPINVYDVLAVAKRAGAAIMQHLNADLGADIKPDGSKVTQADKAADAIVKQHLRRLTPGIPILSEEDTPAERAHAVASRYQWVVDPLDGTNTAYRYAQGAHDRNQFGVHIALLDGGVPVLGVVFCPAMEEGKGVAYFTGMGSKKAYKQIGEDAPRAIQVSRPPLKNGVRAAVHAKPDRRPKQLEGHAYQAVTGVGGQRLCLVAEGAAELADMNDIPTELRDSKAYKQWDLAAGHAILKAAGGELIDVITKRPVIYDNADFLMPGAIAGGRETLNLLVHTGLALRSAPAR